MGTRSEFHGNVGQVVVGTVNTAPRSSNVFTIGGEGQQGSARAKDESADRAASGCAAQAAQIRQAKWILMGQTAMIALLAGCLLFSQRSVVSESYCLSKGRQHSIGSIILMAGKFPAVCTKPSEGNAPVWKSIESQPYN